LDASPVTGFNGFANLNSGTPFNSEQFISLSSSNLGTVRFGVPNAALFRAQGASQPFGTGFGSGYSSTFSRMGYTQGYAVSDYLGTPLGTGTQLRVVRMQNTIQYESNVMNGFSVMAEYAAQNDNATSTTAFGGNTPEFMGLLVNYSAGNTNVAAAYNTVKRGLNLLSSGWGISNGYNLTVVTAGLNTSSLAANQNIA
jgi:predicted porin